MVDQEGKTWKQIVIYCSIAVKFFTIIMLKGFMYSDSLFHKMYTLNWTT